MGSALLLLLCTVSACGTRYSSAPDNDQSTSSSPSSSPTTSLSSVSIPGDGQATIDATTDDGDTASVSVDFGSPTTFSDSTGTPASACADDVDPDRTVVLPVRISGTLTSSLAATVTVEPVAKSLNTHGSFHLDWAVDYSDSGPTCHLDSDDDVFGFTWTQMQPQARQSTTAFLVIDDAISPDDPDGTDLAKLSLIQPRILVNHQLTSNDYSHEVSPTGSRNMDCPIGLVDGAAASVVVDHDLAVANGCRDLSE